MKDRKPFRDTKFGAWLKEHDSEMFEFIGNRIPENKKVIKSLFLLLAKLTDEKKKEGSKLIDLD